MEVVITLITLSVATVVVLLISRVWSTIKYKAGRELVDLLSDGDVFIHLLTIPRSSSEKSLVPAARKALLAEPLHPGGQWRIISDSLESLRLNWEVDRVPRFQIEVMVHDPGSSMSAEVPADQSPVEQWWSIEHAREIVISVLDTLDMRYKVEDRRPPGGSPGTTFDPSDAREKAYPIELVIGRRSYYTVWIPAAGAKPAEFLIRGSHLVTAKNPGQLDDVLEHPDSLSLLRHRQWDQLVLPDELVPAPEHCFHLDDLPDCMLEGPTVDSAAEMADTLAVLTDLASSLSLYRTALVLHELPPPARFAEGY